MIGKIISISGLDGAGKSTQLELLRKKLDHAGVKCAGLQFEAEDYGERAQLKVNDLKRNQVIFSRLCIDWKNRFPLMHDFVYSESLQNKNNAMAVTSVFAGGCLQVYHECLKPLLAEGVHIILDRYWFDDIIYRGFWVDEATVRLMYSSIPAPDLAIFLNTPPAISFDRNQERIDGKSPLMRDIQNVKIISDKFNELARNENMFIVDGSQELEVKHNKIFNKVYSFLYDHPEGK